MRVTMSDVFNFGGNLLSWIAYKHQRQSVQMTALRKSENSENTVIFTPCDKLRN